MPEIRAESYITSSTITTAVENLQTPTLVSPHSNTPPTATAKLGQLKDPALNAAERAGSEPLDPNVLSKRLKGMEDAGRIRERTPGASPSRKRQRIYGDRSVDYAISVSRVCCCYTQIRSAVAMLLLHLCALLEDLQEHALTEFPRRFIPNRDGQDLQASFSLLHDDASPATPSKAKRRTPHGELHFQKSELDHIPSQKG